MCSHNHHFHYSVAVTFFCVLLAVKPFYGKVVLGSVIKMRALLKVRQALTGVRKCTLTRKCDWKSVEGFDNSRFLFDI